MKNGIKGLKIAYFWVINSERCTFMRRRNAEKKNLKGGRRGGGDDRNAQFIPLQLHLCTVYTCVSFLRDSRGMEARGMGGAFEEP